MLEKLAHMPKARAILPVVRLFYGALSSYSRQDDAGKLRTVTQGEGGEQGDPLMPLLFSIGINGALEDVVAHLKDGEQLCAFRVCSASHAAWSLCSRCCAILCAESTKVGRGSEQERDSTRGH